MTTRTARKPSDRLAALAAALATAAEREELLVAVEGVVAAVDAHQYLHAASPRVGDLRAMVGRMRGKAEA